jgi:hypothetical protein
MAWLYSQIGRHQGLYERPNKPIHQRLPIRKPEIKDNCMSKKFRVSVHTPLKWPNKCAVCGENATTVYEAHGGLIELACAFTDYPGIKTKVQSISYPICSKHKYTTITIRILYFISFWGMLFSGFVGLIFYKKGLFTFSALAIFLISLIAFIASIKWKPVRLRWGYHFFTIIIRNDQYAREFALVNNIE